MNSITTRSSLAMGCGLALLVGLGNAAGAAEPYGLWVRPSTGTQVRFYDCGGKLCGKIVAVTQEARKKELGIVIMHGAAKTATTSGKATCSTPKPASSIPASPRWRAPSA